MNHNIVVVDGKEYKAVPCESCEGCHFIGKSKCLSLSCTIDARDDEVNVVFKPHYKLKHKQEEV